MDVDSDGLSCDAKQEDKKQEHRDEGSTSSFVAVGVGAVAAGIGIALALNSGERSKLVIGEHRESLHAENDYDVVEVVDENTPLNRRDIVEYRRNRRVETFANILLGSGIGTEALSVGLALFSWFYFYPDKENCGGSCRIYADRQYDENSEGLFYWDDDSQGLFFWDDGSVGNAEISDGGIPCWVPTVVAAGVLTLTLMASLLLCLYRMRDARLQDNDDESHNSPNRQHRGNGKFQNNQNLNVDGERTARTVPDGGDAGGMRADEEEHWWDSDDEQAADIRKKAPRGAAAAATGREFVVPDDNGFDEEEEEEIAAGGEVSFGADDDPSAAGPSSSSGRSFTRR